MSCSIYLSLSDSLSLSLLSLYLSHSLSLTHSLSHALSPTHPSLLPLSLSYCLSLTHSLTHSLSLSHTLSPSLSFSSLSFSLSLSFLLLSLPPLSLPPPLSQQILECSLFTTTVLAEIFIPIPDSKQSRHSSIPVAYSFSNDRVIPATNTAVGSGVCGVVGLGGGVCVSE